MVHRGTFDAPAFKKLKRSLSLSLRSTACVGQSSVSSSRPHPFGGVNQSFLIHALLLFCPQEVMSERAKEQQELERKLVKMGRQLDHLERAKREEEVRDCMVTTTPLHAIVM